MTPPAPDAPNETRWEGRVSTVKQQGTWEYVSRSRGIHAAVILAIDEDDDGRHVILVEQYRVPLKINCLELPAGLVGDGMAGEAAEITAERELEEETGYRAARSEEHTSELQSLMRISYAVFCLKKKKN